MRTEIFCEERSSFCSCEPATEEARYDCLTEKDRSSRAGHELQDRPAADDAPETPRLAADWCHGYGEQPTNHSRARHCLRAPCPRPLPPVVSSGGPWPAVDGAEDKLHKPGWPLSWAPDTRPNKTRHLQAVLRHRELLEGEGSGELLPVCRGCFHYCTGDPEVPCASAAEPMVLHHLPGS